MSDEEGGGSPLAGILGIGVFLIADFFLWYFTGWVIY